MLLENCRVNVGEKKDDEALARKMAALCDVYVNDASARRTAPRPPRTASLVSRRWPAPVRCWKPSWTRWAAPCMSPRPLVAIVGGSKVSTKLSIL